MTAYVNWVKWWPKQKQDKNRKIDAISKDESLSLKCSIEVDVDYDCTADDELKAQADNKSPEVTSELAAKQSIDLVAH